MVGIAANNGHGVIGKVRTSISRRTCPTYRRRSWTSASSRPNIRASVDSTILEYDEELFMKR